MTHKAICNKLPLCFFVLLIAILAFNIDATAQEHKLGAPLIKNYKPSDFKAAPQNYSVVQNNTGVLYFGNIGKVLEYDGVHWRQIPIDADVPVIAMTIDSTGTVYLTTGNEFGYLAPTSSGKLKYISLSQQINHEEEYVENNGNTFITNEGVYFQTPSLLIKYPYALIAKIKKQNNNGMSVSDKPEVIKSETGFTHSYVIDNSQIFVHQTDLGLSQLIDGSFEPFEKGGKFIERKTVAILPFERKQIVVCTEKGIYYYTGGRGFGRFSSETQDFYDKVEILHAAATPEAYVFSTLNRGTVVVERDSDNKKRQIIEQYNKRAGLTTEQITSIYNNTTRDNRKLWLTSQYGISMTKLNSPLRNIYEAVDVRDVILDMKHHNGDFYVRTLGEIYYLKDTTDGYHFYSVDNLVSNTDWLSIPMELDVKKEVEATGLLGAKRRRPKYETVTEIQERLIAASKNGLFLIDNNKAKKIHYDIKLGQKYSSIATSKNYKPEYQIVSLQKSRIDSSRIYLGLDDGIAVVSLQNRKWIDEGRIEGVTETVINTAEDKNGSIWLAVKNNGVIKVSFADEIKHSIKIQETKKDTLWNHFMPQSYEVKRFGRADGLPKMVGKGVFYSDYLKNKKCGGLLFLTRKGLYRLEGGKFVADDIFGSNLSNGTLKVLDIVDDGTGNFWLRTQNEYETGIDYFERDRDGNYSRNNKAFKLLPKMTVQAVYPDTTGVIWIGGTDGLYSYDTKSEDTTLVSFHSLIRKVTIGKDSVVFRGANYANDMSVTHSQADIFHLDYTLNNIRFEFAAPFFEEESATQYSYILEGFDDDWSDWSNETKKEYTNLPKKSYVFRVKAKNVYGVVSSEAEYRFVVPVPWHETFWFQLFEVGLFSLLIIISVLLNRSGKGAKITQILTMLAVVTIFKVLGAYLLGPFIVMFSYGITFFKILLDVLIGAALLPIWSLVMRLIQSGTTKKVENE